MKTFLAAWPLLLILESKNHYNVPLWVNISKNTQPLFVSWNSSHFSPRLGWEFYSSPQEEHLLLDTFRIVQQWIFPSKNWKRLLRDFTILPYCFEFFRCNQYTNLILAATNFFRSFFCIFFIGCSTGTDIGNVAILKMFRTNRK